jgi:hypothetical protein
LARLAVVGFGFKMCVKIRTLEENILVAMKILLHRFAWLMFFLVFFIPNSLAQEGEWFYLRANSDAFEPSFQEREGKLIYTGDDYKLKSILEDYDISIFKKTQKNAKKPYLHRTFFIIADRKSLLDDLLIKANHLFDSGEVIPMEDRKIFEPNDYGLTSTIGENLGLPVNMDYMDFLGVPKAWYYTTGERDVIIGISDASVDTTNIEFAKKTKVIRKSVFAGGHGIGSASASVAQGNNGYGVAGVCYDCSVFTTIYGDFKEFRQLRELSKLGAKVINCSWVGVANSETGQAAIDEMFDNGTIVVASSGNRSYQKNKGEEYLYPASYDKVISVGSAMYKYDTPWDNIKINKEGTIYAENIRGYLSRTVAFKDQDTSRTNDSFKNYEISIPTLNSEVDILSPTVGVFLFASYVMNDTLAYNRFPTTSGAANFVSGTIGLMFSLAPCLPTQEVESILKMTAYNIDHIEANKKFKGKYGAGILQTGRAVEMVYQLFTETETVTIEDQDFERWDFKLTSYSKEVRLQNQKFRERATLDLRSKNRIVLGENTVLKPNSEGQIRLSIHPEIEPGCYLRLRDKSIRDSDTP